MIPDFGFINGIWHIKNNILFLRILIQFRTIYSRGILFLQQVLCNEGRNKIVAIGFSDSFSRVISENNSLSIVYSDLPSLQLSRIHILFLQDTFLILIIITDSMVTEWISQCFKFHDWSFVQDKNINWYNVELEKMTGTFNLVDPCTSKYMGTTLSSQTE